MRKIPTARDIRFGLAVNERRKPPTRTAQREAEIRRHVEENCGPILSPATIAEIKKKEEKRAQKVNRSRMKSWVMILRQKERMNTILECRKKEEEGENSEKPPKITKITSSDKEERGEFNEISFGY